MANLHNDITTWLPPHLGYNNPGSMDLALEWHYSQEFKKSNCFSQRKWFQLNTLVSFQRRHSDEE